MWIKPLTVLMAKDLRLHGRAVSLAIASVLVLCAVATQVISSGVGPRLAFVFNVNLVLTLLWSDWLVTRERSKRTFAWLRTLPLDDGVLAGSKFLAAGGCCVVTWALSSALFAPELWSPLGTVLALQAALLAFGALSISTKWRFPWRLGHVLPLLILVVPVLLFVMLAGDGTSERAQLVAVWNAPDGRLVVTALLLLIYTAIIWTTIRWVMRADTFQLVD